MITPPFLTLVSFNRIECIDHCSENDSELIYYRHFAKLLDYLFKDTNLLLLEYVEHHSYAVYYCALY